MSAVHQTVWRIGVTTESTIGMRPLRLRDVADSQGWYEAIHGSGWLTTDAHLAALAIEHQAELHSTDADMARVPGFR